MKHFPRIFRLIVVAALLTLATVQTALADPPSRVARLSYITGELIFSPASENRWVKASLNRPLIVGDRLWSYDATRAELQLGGASLFIASGTSVGILNLNDKLSQFKLTQGRVTLSVRDNSREYEIDTPNLAFVIKDPGSYSVIVDAKGDATIVTVRQGKAIVYGQNVAYRVGAKQSFRFTGTALRSERIKRVEDNFDHWCNSRAVRKLTTVRYVSPEVIGYEDLETHGTWVPNKRYGQMWQPRVGASWAPYREGHWAWIEPWGWTWVDNQPWGFAPFHYGRWVYVSTRWYWVPGPRTARPVYAPALVAFVSTPKAQVAWFPLGPGDIYRPAYSTSRDYFVQVNMSNMSIRQSIVTEYYTQPTRPVTYVNRQYRNAVTAVPSRVFVEAKPVAQAAVTVQQEVLTAPVVAVAPAAPTAVSVAGSSQTVDKPAEKVNDTKVVVQNTPAPAPVAFSAQESKLAAEPGKPLDEKALSVLQPPNPKDETIKASDAVPAEVPAANQPPVEVNLPKDELKVEEAVKAEEPKAVEEPKPEAPKVDEPKPEAPKVDEPKPEAPKVDEPKPEAPKVDEPKPEAPKVDEPKPEAPKVDEPKPEAPKPEASPKAEEPPVIEAPKPEAPKVDEPKPEALKPEASPKAEEPPVIEAPKPERKERIEIPPAPDKPPVEAPAPMREIPEPAKREIAPPRPEPVEPSMPPQEPPPAPEPLPPAPEPLPKPEPEPAVPTPETPLPGNPGGPNVPGVDLDLPD